MIKREKIVMNENFKKYNKLKKNLIIKIQKRKIYFIDICVEKSNVLK